MTAKPVLQYPGSKMRLAQRIVDLLGPHTSYFEPYCGSAAVLLAKPRAAVETIGDLSDLLILFYRTLRDQRYDLVDAMVNTPYARKEFELARQDDPALSAIERSRRFMIRNNMAFVGSNGKGTWTATTRGSSGHSNATKWMNYTTRLSETGERLAGVQIENIDALELLARAVAANDPDIAVYLDPPYVMETRNGVIYQYDIEPAHHTAMLALAVQLPGPTVVSGYQSSLYADTLEGAGWTRIEVSTASSSSAGRGSVANRTEILWASPACVTPELPEPLEEVQDDHEAVDPELPVAV